MLTNIVACLSLQYPLLLPTRTSSVQTWPRRAIAFALDQPSFISEAAASATPSLAYVVNASADDTSAALLGGACAIEVEGERFFLTAASLIAGDADSVKLTFDIGEKAVDASIVGTTPEVDLALLKLPEAVAQTSALALEASDNLEEGDFVISLGYPDDEQAVHATLGMLSGRTSLPSFKESSDSKQPPPGTAEAAMIEAEKEAEREAEKRGEMPFLVSSAASGEAFLRGGPLMDAEGSLVGIQVMVISAGEGATRYYSVAAPRATRAVEAILERRSRAEQIQGARVVLFNDSVNKREKVAKVLAAAGLSEQAASFAMMAAHMTGRGVIGYFEDPAQAKALVDDINRLSKGLSKALEVTAEACSYFKGDGGTDTGSSPTDTKGGRGQEDLDEAFGI